MKASLPLLYVVALALLILISNLVAQSLMCTQCTSTSMYKIGEEKFCQDHYNKAELQEQNAEQMVNGSIRRSIYSY